MQPDKPMSLGKAVLSFRCSHCRQGKVFKSLWHTNETCPVCGIQFEREYGYFLMSIFMGYIWGFLVILPAMLTMLLIGGFPIYLFVIVAMVLLLLFSPLIFRLSRVSWLHIDELLDPREDVTEWRQIADEN
ncbi:MAG: DUF983 domain-containing protein [Anaerolineae bacterium]|nr:DUF983 domain-containing protein [Anaerolineae bacterium]